MPSHADAMNLPHNKLCQIYYVPFLLAEKFVDLFLLLNKFCWPFSSHLLIFVNLFCFFGHFLHLFEFFSVVTCAKIPLCTKNCATQMCQVRHKRYYAGRTLKFLAQSCHYAKHIWHNMYFSSLDPSCFQFTSTISTTVSLVKLVVIKYGCHIISCSYWQCQGGCFSLFLVLPEGPHHASNII